MEDCYEIVGVQAIQQIKQAYEAAVAQNKKFYRAVSASGKIYGWEITPGTPQGHKVNAQPSQEWFINPYYVEPQENVEEVVDELVEIEPEQIDDVPGYKEMYEKSVVENKSLQETIESIEAEIEVLKAAKEELQQYKTAFEAIKALWNKGE